MAMNKMIDVRVEAEAMLLALTCATLYVKGETTDPVMMNVTKKINGVAEAVETAFWKQVCEYGRKCGECDTEKSGKDCPLRQAMEDKDNDSKTVD